MYTMDEMYRLGMDYLVREFGIVNTELFINAVKMSGGDFTAEHHTMFDDLSLEEFDAALIECGRRYESK